MQTAKPSRVRDVGENLDKACEACHRSYWYPGEGAEFYQKLQRRLEEFRALCAANDPHGVLRNGYTARVLALPSRTRY